MNRKIKVTSLAAVALTSLFLASVNTNHVVKAADEGSQPATTARSQTPKEAAEANVNSAQQNVHNAQQELDSANSDLSNAKANAVKPDSDYDAQNKVNEAAKTDLNNKQSALNKAKTNEKSAEDIANKAKDPANITKAKQDVNNQNKVVSDATQAKKDADNAVTNKQTEISNDQTTAKAKHQDVTTKATIKADADQQVKNAEDALKGTGLLQAEKNYKDTQQAMQNSQSVLDNTKADLSNDNKKLPDLTKNESDAKAAAKTASDAEQIAKNKADSLNTQAKNAQQAVANQKKTNEQLAQTGKDLAEKSQNTINIGNVDAFKQAYAHYLNNKNFTQADIDYFKETAEENEYKPAESDTHEEVDLSKGLTEEQAEEIDRFSTDLLNKVRAQLGFSTVKDDEVNKGAINLTNEITARYNQDYANGSWKDGWHDVEGINEVAQSNGFKYENPEGDEQPYENMAGDWMSPKTNMASLKQLVYNKLLGMIIPDGHGIDNPHQTAGYEMAHTAGLLGINRPTIKSLNKLVSDYQKDLVEVENDESQNQQNSWTETVDNKVFHFSSNEEYANWLNDQLNNLRKEKQQVQSGNYIISDNDIAPVQYTAVGFTILNKAQDRNRNNDEPLIKVHFINVNPDDILNRNSYNSTTVPSYQDQINDNNNAQNNGEASLGSLRKHAADLKSQSDQANQAYNEAKQNAQNKANEATKAEQNVQNLQKEINNLNDQIPKYQAQLDKDIDAYNKAKQRYDTLTASNKDKAKNLAKAEKAQSDAQDALNQAQKAANDADAKVTQDQKDLKNLQTTANQKATALKQANDDLQAKQKTLFDLQHAPQILADAKVKVQKAQTDYDAAKKVADDAQAKLDSLKPAKDAADQQVQAAQAAVDAAQKNLADAQSKLAEAKAELDRVENAYVPGKAQGKKSSKAVKTNENKQGKTVKKTATAKKIKMARNGYAYARRGLFMRAIKINKKHVVLKKHAIIKPYNHAKIYTINGKRYYKIGRNRYVRVIDTIKSKVGKKIRLHLVVKGRKNRKIVLYNQHGKRIKKYVLAGHSYKFDRKMTIKGKTYYRLAGKEEWLPSKKLILK